MFTQKYAIDNADSKYCKISKLVGNDFGRVLLSRAHLSLAGLGMLWLTYTPNLKSIASPITEIINVLHDAKMGWLGVIRSHARSSVISPFDRAHMISYSSLIETVRPSCTVFEIQRAICQNSPTSIYPTCISRPRWG